MKKVQILDCTLRDGGYITGWKFTDSMICEIIQVLLQAKLDYVEVGYLNTGGKDKDSTQFKNINQIIPYLPKQRKGSMLLAMADVLQFQPEDLIPYDGKSIDAIRVVFYKHQIEEAFVLGKAVKEAGYKLFMQPMVTIDYSIEEYAALVKCLADIQPYGVAIVDSFGYMMKEDFRRYFKILDTELPQETMIGFHSHNNMNLAFITAQDILEYETDRTLIIDASLYGMGRGAGNLQTELIANYYNTFLSEKYNLSRILELIGKFILPIQKEKRWGYSPYMLITGLYHCHPNFACYLLDEYPDVDMEEFEDYIKAIPVEMRTKCKKPYVLEFWNSLHK